MRPTDRGFRMAAAAKFIASPGRGKRMVAALAGFTVKTPKITVKKQLLPVKISAGQEEKPDRDSEGQGEG